jgi:hypothetical protein
LLKIDPLSLAEEIGNEIFKRLLYQYIFEFQPELGQDIIIIGAI